jgi:predicted ATPase
VLIGPNSAGKSSLLEVLHVFRSVTEFDLRKTLIEDRGGVDMVKTAGADGPISLEIVIEPSRGWPVEKDRGTVHYGFEIESLSSGQFHIHREWLDIYRHGPNEKPLNVLTRTQPGSFPLLLDVEQKKHVEARISALDLCIHAVRLPGSFPTLENVRKTLLSLSIYGGFDVRPPWVGRVAAQNGTPRSAAIIADDARIESTGRNLVNVLYHLREEQPESFKGRILVLIY